MKLHYKMFKKGKNWCTMALTTAAIVAGVAFTITANADSVDNTNVN
ncbi:KxYKxGKxW signal peptide domain-containing protein, partial [Limosilactobacillus coleohominis]